MDHLVATRAEDDRAWRATAAALGHTISYMATVVTTGKPPEAASDGSPYAEPRPGMLTTPNPSLADWQTNGRLSHLLGALGAAADALGLDEVASRRALQSFDMARAANELLTICTMGARHAIGLVVSDRLPDALDVALQSAAATEALSIIRKEGGNLYATDRTAQQVIGPKPSPAWSTAELNAVTYTVFPMLVRLASHKLEGHPNVTRAGLRHRPRGGRHLGPRFYGPASEASSSPRSSNGRPAAHSLTWATGSARKSGTRCRQWRTSGPRFRRTRRPKGRRSHTCTSSPSRRS